MCNLIVLHMSSYSLLKKIKTVTPKKEKTIVQHRYHDELSLLRKGIERREAGASPGWNHGWGMGLSPKVSHLLRKHEVQSIGGKGRNQEKRNSGKP